MQIEWFKELDSTQKELERRIKSKQNITDLCIVAERQDSGLGSRGTKWENEAESLMFSFVYSRLPDDLPLQSVAIFFGCVLKETLRNLGSKVWLKWPNDLYVDDKKIGGILVWIIQKRVVCGIGLNLKAKHYACLDINIDKKALLEQFFFNLEKTRNWKQIFRNYKLEFHRNFPFSFHLEDEVISLEGAVLLDDGSIEINKKRIYNARCAE